MTMPELLYRQLAQHLAQQIDKGALMPGNRLPSVRQMANDRQVSVSTAVQAYRELERLGLIEARPQSGFFVAPTACRTALARPTAKLEQAVLVSISNRLMRVLSLNARPGMIPLGAALPDSSLLPLRALQQQYLQAARRSVGLLGAASHTAFNQPELVRQLVRQSLSWGSGLHAEELVVTNSCRGSAGNHEKFPENCLPL